MSEQTGNANRRLSERVGLRLRVDAKSLADIEVHRILEGEGFPDLGQPSLARRMPRSGMVALNSEDLSLSGLGLEGELLLEPGMALVLDLHLPQDPVVVKALAEVVWVGGEGSRRRAGLRFAAMHWMEAQRLRRALGLSSSN